MSQGLPREVTAGQQQVGAEGNQEMGMGEANQCLSLHECRLDDAEAKQGIRHEVKEARFLLTILKESGVQGKAANPNAGR